MGKGALLCTLTSEIAIFRWNSQHYRGSGARNVEPIAFYRRDWGPRRTTPSNGNTIEDPDTYPARSPEAGPSLFRSGPVCVR